MTSAALTIRWHGVLQQKSPWMDGVPFVSQCPIHPGALFRYDFTVDELGTYLYHAHTGIQKTFLTCMFWYCNCFLTKGGGDGGEMISLRGIQRLRNKYEDLLNLCHLIYAHWGVTLYISYVWQSGHSNFISENLKKNEKIVTWFMLIWSFQRSKQRDEK